MAKALDNEATIRLYGLPYEIAVPQAATKQNAKQGEEEPVIAFLYYGHRVGLSELRRPTNRVWQLRRADVLSRGDVKDFVVEEKQVQYFDIELGTSVREKKFTEVNVDEECGLRGEVFAAGLAEVPAADAPSGDAVLAVAQALASRIGVGGGPGGGGLGLAWGSTTTGNPCARYTQTYRDTYWNGITTSDVYGADCVAED